MNGRKGTHTDILDPFHVKNGWFIIDFPSLLVKPANGLEVPLEENIKRTIDRLGLNDEDTCLKSRLRYVMAYCEQNISFDYLMEEAPFIASELERQGLKTKIGQIMES